MIKKIATMLLAAIMAICCTVAFTACGSGGNETGDEIGGGVIGGDTHEHTFSDQWSNDETYHWHAATCEHTDEVSDEAEHTIENGACTVCSYKQPTEGLEYTLSYDGTAYSVSGIGWTTETDISIAYTYNGKPVTDIGWGAFRGCTSLTSVTIPSSVTYIGVHAFHDCTSLTSVTIPSSVTSIGGYAFAGCESLTNVTIPGSVTRIGNNAFDGCESLTSVAIPSSVKSIEYAAFNGCTSLASVNIPNSVTSIDDHVFGYCPSLASITVERGNNVYHSAGNCLIETESKTLIAGCSNSVIPTDGSVTSIGDDAFRHCPSLTSVTIPSSVTIIDDYAFAGCTYLKSVAILGDVTSISERAFSWCTYLESITIPSSVTIIGNYAFNGCGHLTSIYYGGTAEQWNEISIGSSNSLADATCYYYSETNPFEGAGAVTEGNYWHYVDGVPTVWAK